MFEVGLAAGFVLAAVIAITSENLFARCFGTKLAGDFLAVLLIGFSGPDDSSLRIVALVIVSIVALFCLLMGIVGGATYTSSSKEEVP